MTAPDDQDDSDALSADSSLQAAFAHYKDTGGSAALIDVFRRAVAEGKNFSGKSQSYIVHACQHADPVLLEILLNNGADANHGNGTLLRLVTLHDGKGKNHPDILACIKLLVAHGVDPHAAGSLSLRHASDMGHTDAVRYFLERGVPCATYPSVMVAAYHGMDDLVEKISREQNPSLKDFNMALLAAAGAGHRHVVNQLLALAPGADTSILAASAAIGGHLALLKELVNKGYKLDFDDPGLLKGIVDGDHGDVLDFMLDNGVDFTAAHELYTKITNAERKPLPSVHKIMQRWTYRRLPLTTASLPDNISTMEDLRKTNPDFQGKPLTTFVNMVRANCLDLALEIVKSAPENKLTVEDLLETDSDNNTVLEILGERKRLGQLFTPELWPDRVDDLRKIWEEIAPIYRDQVNFQGIFARDRLKRVKAIAPPSIRFKKS